jgi:Fe-S-cluster formation regulator IscX/YfhJ
MAEPYAKAFDFSHPSYGPLCTYLFIQWSTWILTLHQYPPDPATPRRVRLPDVASAQMWYEIYYLYKTGMNPGEGLPWETFKYIGQSIEPLIFYALGYPLFVLYKLKGLFFIDRKYHIDFENKLAKALYDAYQDGTLDPELVAYITSLLV